MGKLKDKDNRSDKIIIKQKKTPIDKDLLLKIIETEREAINITSDEGKIIYTNRAMDELFGYEKGELIGKHPSVLNAGKKPELMTAQRMKRIGEKGDWEGEIFNKKKDGAEFYSYARISAFKDENKNVKYFLSTQHDITEQRKMKEALEKSEKKYRALVENALDAIYVISVKEGFEYVNPAFERLFGYKCKDICHKNFQFLDLVHHHDRDFIEKRRKNRKKHKNLPSIYQFKGVTREGELKYVEVNTVPLPGEENKILGILRDITELKQSEMSLKKSESKLRKQKFELEQKNIALRELISQIELEKKRTEENVESNVETLILPLLDRLKLENIDNNYSELLRHNLTRLTSSFGNSIVKKNFNLTPREIEICNMLKSGLSSKEISKLLYVSLQTIIRHRKNIRLKLGISRKNINLVSFLYRL